MPTGESSRLDKVETEIGGLKQGLADVRSDVKGLGGILHRIEQSVTRSQEQQEEREQSRRHSPIALATVLVTIMSMLIGGAWVIGSTTSRTEVRLNDEDVQMSRLMQMRDRELDMINHRVDRLEDRGSRGEPSQK